MSATWNCFVIGVYGSELSKWEGVFKGNVVEVSHLTSGDIWWIFCVGDFSGDRPFNIYLYPTIGDIKSYKLFNSSQAEADANDGYYVQNGKWYLFHTDDVSIQAGSIGFDYPNWEAGN